MRSYRLYFFFSSRRRHTRYIGDWSSDVCSSDLPARELADWRKRLIDYLIRSRSFDEARLLVATIKREQTDQERALERDEQDGSTSEYRYDWLPLRSEERRVGEEGRSRGWASCEE